MEENPSNYFLGKDYGKINKAKQEKGLTKSIMDISYKKERDDMKKQCDELKQNLKAFEIKLNYNNEMIYQIEPTKKKNKNELRQIIKLKKKFLLKLLKLGKDFRFFFKLL